MAKAALDNIAITDHEAQEVKRANASGLFPVVFVHGLWLLPTIDNGWREVAETALKFVSRFEPEKGAS